MPAKRAEGVTVDGVHFFMTKLELKEWTARRQKMAKVTSCVLIASFLSSHRGAYTFHDVVTGCHEQDVFKCVSEYRVGLHVVEKVCKEHERCTGTHRTLSP